MKPPSKLTKIRNTKTEQTRLFISHHCFELRMFWGKKKTEDDKEKQLKQLKNAFPSIRRPQNDDALFEIRFMVDNQSNALRIFIPSDFPQTRPGKRSIGSFGM